MGPRVDVTFVFVPSIPPERALAVVRVVTWVALVLLVAAVLTAVVSAPFTLPGGGPTDWTVFVALVGTCVLGTVLFAVADVVIG